MIQISLATIDDANELLKIQSSVFKKYTDKYGCFERNPADMTLERIKFNINYAHGQYYAIRKNDILIGGIFAFKTEQDNVMKIAQFYILDGFQNQGIGTKVLNYLFAINAQIKHWYVDTIFEEKHNLAFYRRNGFAIIDEEGYDAFEKDHPGLTFVIMKKIK